MFYWVSNATFLGVFKNGEIKVGPILLIVNKWTRQTNFVIFNVSSCQFEWNMFSQIKLMEMIVSGKYIQKHFEATISYVSEQHYGAVALRPILGKVSK